MKIYAIALTTFRELVRSKVLYLVLFFAIMLVAVSALFGSVTIGDQVQVIKDFGLFSVSLFSVGFVVIAGASLLHKELALKTVYNVLSKPVRRCDFLVGKFLGVYATAAVILILMGAGVSIFAWVVEGRFDPLLLLAYGYNLVELFIVCAAVIFFSSIVVTPLLSGLFTLGFFLAGRCADYILYFINEGTLTSSGATVLNAIYWLMPHLNDLYIGNTVVHGVIPGITHALFSVVYGFCYAAILLLIAVFVFSRREFN